MPTSENDLAHDEFRPNDRIRLIVPHGDYAVGARGHIIGRFARFTDPTWVVAFDGDACSVELQGIEFSVVAV